MKIVWSGLLISQYEGLLVGSDTLDKIIAYLITYGYYVQVSGKINCYLNICWSVLGDY